MGAWGTSLYANDYASDIRGDYVDMLRRGKTNDEVVKILTHDNQGVMDDDEEGALFWFALADTLWNYGRLQDSVKEKALYFLELNKESERWRDAGQKQLEAWQKTLDKLKKKLLSEQPPEKKVSPYRFYKNPWQLGDVYAYQFSSDYSKEQGYFGQYIVFRKVGEDVEWPGHIIPTVHFYKRITPDIPALDDLHNTPLLPQNHYPALFIKKPEAEIEYAFNLYGTNRAVPKDRLTLLGNIPGDDFLPFLGLDFYTGYQGSIWKFIEVNIINQFNAWKDDDAPHNVLRDARVSGVRMPSKGV